MLAIDVEKVSKQVVTEVGNRCREQKQAGSYKSWQ